MTNNLPSGVRYILFWYNEGDTDKLHIMQKGIESAHVALKTVDLWDHHNVIFLYFVTPVRKYTSLKIATQLEISRDRQPLSVLSLSAARLWRSTLDSIYNITADAAINMSMSGGQKRASVLRKLRRGSFTTYEAFQMYVAGIRLAKREGGYTDAMAASATTRLALLQKSLSGGFYGFPDFQNISPNWHTMSTVGTDPNERYNTLYRASTSGLANIAIAAVYVEG